MAPLLEPLDLHSPPPSSPPTRPTWLRQQGRRISNAPRVRDARDQATNAITNIRRGMERSWNQMDRRHKIISICVGLFFTALTITFIATRDAIFRWALYIRPRWKEKAWGAPLLWGIIVLEAFPPMVGYSLSLTLTGFVWEVWPGWPIAATANTVGAVLAFLAFRHLLRGLAQRLAKSFQNFAALALVIEHDGLLLLTLIRLSPLPYSLSNAALSTIPGLSPWRFGLATALASPKLMIHCLIGNSLRQLLEDSDHAGAKSANRGWEIFSIFFGITLGLGTGWYVYKRTMRRAAELEAQEQVKGEALVRRGRVSVADDDDLSLDLENDDLDFRNDSSNGRSGRYVDEP